MKTYKYNINGNDYEVAVEGSENYVATVTVNGESYTVKMPEPENPPVLRQFSINTMIRGFA